MNDPIIIIGAGLAGYQLAREFRKLDQTTPLWMVTADEGHYYSKPQLSNALTNKKNAQTLITSEATQISEQLNLTLFPHTTVTAIDPNAHQITFGEIHHRYHALVLACGAEPSRPPLHGEAAGDVLSVNHLSDYATFRAAIENKPHVTLLGAGLIGCEFANDLANTGHTVHVITPAATPMELLLPEDIGHLFQAALTRHGIFFHTGCVAENIAYAADKRYEVTLSDGTVITTDTILAATGLKPVTTLTVTAGIETRLGIVTNRFLETSAKDVYAIGDCAEVEGFVLPYITPLLNCARALSKTLTGNPTAVEYPAMPVTIKTPACPVMVCPPPKTMTGAWKTDISTDGARALFYGDTGTLHGFVLMGDRTKERSTLMKLIPPLISIA